MGEKRKLTLTVDPIAIEHAKHDGINISAFLEEALAERPRSPCQPEQYVAALGDDCIIIQICTVCRNVVIVDDEGERTKEARQLLHL